METAEHLSYFLQAKTGEEPQFTDSRCALVDRGEARQSFMDCQYLIPALLAAQPNFVEVDFWHVPPRASRSGVNVRGQPERGTSCRNAFSRASLRGTA